MTTHLGAHIQTDASKPPTDMVARTEGAWWTRLDRTSSAMLLAGEFTAILLIWQLAVGVLELINPVFLPAPAAIAGGLWELASTGEIWPHLSLSLGAWLLGYGLAVAVGVAMGIMVGSSVAVHRLAGPILWSLYATPWLAYRPLSTIWFGFGLSPIIFLVFIASLFPVLLNTAAGVGATDSSLLNAGRIYGSSRLARYRKIVLPSSLPFIFAGARQSVVMATIALLVAEMTGSGMGVGALIMFKTNTYQTEQTYAVILIAMVWTLSMSQFVRMIAKRVAPWQDDARQR